MNIKIPDHCQSCRFWLDTEDDDAICVLYGRDMPKDEDFEPIKQPWCVADTVIVMGRKECES